MTSGEPPSGLLAYLYCLDCGQEYQPALACACPPRVVRGDVLVRVEGTDSPTRCPECREALGSNPDCPTCKGAGYREW